MEIHEDEPGKPYVEFEYEIRAQYDRMIQPWEFIVARTGKFPPDGISHGINPIRCSAQLDLVSAPEIGFDQEGSERGHSEESEDDSVKSEHSYGSESWFVLNTESVPRRGRADTPDSEYLPPKGESIPAEDRHLRIRPMGQAPSEGNSKPPKPRSQPATRGNASGRGRKRVVPAKRKAGNQGGRPASRFASEDEEQGTWRFRQI